MINVTSIQCIICNKNEITHTQSDDDEKCLIPEYFNLKVTKKSSSDEHIYVHIYVFAVRAKCFA